MNNPIGYYKCLDKALPQYKKKDEGIWLSAVIHKYRLNSLKKSSVHLTRSFLESLFMSHGMAFSFSFGFITPVDTYLAAFNVPFEVSRQSVGQRLSCGRMYRSGNDVLDKSLI